MSDRFENVSVVHKANVYHDGKCTSRTVLFPSGEMKTLGIIHPGSYRFSTDAAEVMEILAGQARYKLAGQGEWQDVQGGERFNIPANSHFEIEVTGLLDYICHFG